MTNMRYDLLPKWGNPKSCLQIWVFGKFPAKRSTFAQNMSYVHFLKALHVRVGLSFLLNIFIASCDAWILLKPLPHSCTVSSVNWQWYWYLIFGSFNLFGVIWVAVNVSGHFFSFQEHKFSGLTLKTAYFSPKLEVTCKKLIRYRHFLWIFTITSILISYSWFVC